MRRLVKTPPNEKTWVPGHVDQTKESSPGFDGDDPNSHLMLFPFTKDPGTTSSTVSHSIGRFTLI